MLLASCSPLDLRWGDRPPGFEPWRIWLYGRPDVVKAGRELDLTSSLDTPIETTIYEYTYQDQSITTGRSRTYRFAKAYYVRSMPFVGVVNSIRISFDFQTKLPFESSAGAGTPTRASMRADAHTEVGATLQALIGGTLPSIEQLVKVCRGGAVDPVTIPAGSGYRDPLYTGESYCGFELFEFERRGNLLARAEQEPPFDRARIFARPAPGGGYSRIVECNPRDIFGWCYTVQPDEFGKGPGSLFRRAQSVPGRRGGGRVQVAASQASYSGNTTGAGLGRTAGNLQRIARGGTKMTAHPDLALMQRDLEGMAC